MTGEGEFAAVRACVFDAYGTLLDVAGPLAAEAAELGDRAGELSALWRSKQLEYSWLRTAMRRHADFERVTAEALDHAMAALGLDAPALRGRLLAAYRRLPPFPDARSALSRLRALGLRTAVLSNGSRAMLAEGLSWAKIAPLVDAVLSVDEVGLFKPAPEVYALATTRLGLAAKAVLFVSGNAWDIHGASSFGLRTVWIDRAGRTDDLLPGGPDRVLRDLAMLPELLAPGGGNR